MNSAEDVLQHFHDRFITDVNANAIVLDLMVQDIISNDDSQTIRSMPNRRQQNQYLHHCLMTTCTKEDFMSVCDIIISVKGNARMCSLGMDMKRMLEGLGVPEPTPPLAHGVSGTTPEVPDSSPPTIMFNEESAVDAVDVPTAEDVLQRFRDQFITVVDANAIVYDLEAQDILSNGDLQTITSMPNRRQQNQYLHHYLKRTCTEGSLMSVCDVIISMEGDPKMSHLGREMKRMLESADPKVPDPPPPAVEKNPESAVDVVDVPTGQDLLKFEEHYAEVIRNEASVTLKITKCTTIGPPRIGKTCLKHLLTGQEWDLKGGTAGTDIMEAPEWVECYSVGEGGAEALWDLVSREQRMGEVLRTVNSESHLTMPSGALTRVLPTGGSVTMPTGGPTAAPPDGTTAKTPDGTTAKTPDGTTTKSPNGTATSSAVPNTRTFSCAINALAGTCSSEALQDFLKDKAGKVLGETHLIHFIDTGGQAIYHDVHPVLITSPSVYLVVFSLEVFYGKNIEGRLEYFRSELIQRPLRSIYTFGRKAPHDQEKKGHLQLHPEAPRIFIVGTHLDRIHQRDKGKDSDVTCEQFLHAVNVMIEMEISTKPYHQFVQYDPKGRSFWAVDNTLAGRKQDEGAKKYISTFRRMIQDRSMEMSVKVPLPWMLLKSVMDGKGVHYLRYSELLKEARIRGYVSEESPSEDLDNMLRLFHILGLIYHKVPAGCEKQDSLVFIDPDCLYSATSDFLMAAKEEIEESHGGSDLEGDPQPSVQMVNRKKQMLGGVDSSKVIQRIGTVVRDFLFHMHTVLCTLERVVMNVGQEPPEVVSQNLAKIQKSVEGNNISCQDANTLQAKYEMLAKEMVFKLTNSIGAVLQGTMSESKKRDLDRIMKNFWFQCRTARRSIEVADFEHLLRLLSDLRIIAELDQQNYVIPVALPQRRDDGCQEREIVEGGIDHEPLLFTLISEDDSMCYLPSGLFCCLISELVTALGWTVVPLGRTHVAFTHKNLTGEVHLRECESYIKVNMESKKPLQVEDLHRIREEMHKRINRVYSVIYCTPDSESALGFQCTCDAVNTPHFAAYQEDEFESCTMCLLPDSTESPLTQEQLVWFP